MDDMSNFIYDIIYILLYCNYLSILILKQVFYFLDGFWGAAWFFTFQKHFLSVRWELLSLVLFSCEQTDETPGT